MSQIYTSLLPLTKEDSPVSIHYAKYANSALRVEYIGKKQHNDCIKTIQVKRRHALTYLLLFSRDGTQILSDSFQNIYVRDATSGKRIAGPLVAEEGDEDDEDEEHEEDEEDDEEDEEYEGDALSAAYSSDGRHIVVATTNGIIRKWDVLTSCLVSERVMSDFQIDSTCAETFAPDRKSVVFGDK